MLLTHGVFACSVSSGHCSGFPSAWTVVMTLKLFAADAGKSREGFKQIVAEMN